VYIPFLAVAVALAAVSADAEPASDQKQQSATRQDVPPKIQAYLEQMKVRQKEVLGELDEFIAQCRKDSSDPQETARSRAFAARELKRLEALRAAIAKRAGHVGLTARNAAVGRIGVLYGDSAVPIQIRVEEVIDDKEMCVRQVVVISDERSMEGQQWLLRGVSTGGFSAGATITLPQTFEVTAAKTRRGADGATKTVFVVEPIDVERYLPKD